MFFLFSSDILENRKHIHVRDRKGRITRLCKFWIEPKIELTYNLGFSKKEINEIEKILKENIELVLHQIEKFRTIKKVKAIKIN